MHFYFLKNNDEKANRSVPLKKKSVTWFKGASRATRFPYFAKELPGQGCSKEKKDFLSLKIGETNSKK